MNKMQNNFWKHKSLNEMTEEEWEILCDGCGICCLQKIEDEISGKVKLTSVSCKYLDIQNCRCTVYEDRLNANTECLELTIAKLKQIKWLPDTCAYRCISEGRDLEWWHPLVSRDHHTVHQARISVKDKAVSGKFVHPEDLTGQMIYKKK